MAHALLRAVYARDLILLKLNTKASLVISDQRIEHGVRVRERIFVVLRSPHRFSDCVHDMLHRFEIRSSDGKVIYFSSLPDEFVLFLIHCGKDSCLKMVQPVGMLINFHIVLRSL